MTILPKSLAERIFTIANEADVRTWLLEVERELGGVSWRSLGGIPNNVHTVEVASDPALALVERPINGLDALLDLIARTRGEDAPTPHAGARQWYDVPEDGLPAMKDDERRKLAGNLRVVMVESGEGPRPSIVIQDAGTGQHPDDFPETLLSLLASNKKTKMHQMGSTTPAAAPPAASPATRSSPRGSRLSCSTGARTRSASALSATTRSTRTSTSRARMSTSPPRTAPSSVSTSRSFRICRTART